MSKLALLASFAAALALGLPAHAAAPITVAQLTKIASKATGLPAKRKIKVVFAPSAVVAQRAVRLLDRDYPSARQSNDEVVYRALGLLEQDQPLRPMLVAHARRVRSVYDPVTQTLWTTSPGGTRAPLLRAIVNALQDQTFGLKRVSSLRRTSRDEAAAANAAVDGSAALYTLLSSRRPTAAGSTPATLFLHLVSSFPSTTGLRFAATLQNIGGRPAVHTALRRMPETTEQIFHVDKYLARERALPLEIPTAVGPFELVHDDTFGELDVRALLATFQVPRLDRVGRGWGAGVSTLYRNAQGESAVALRLSWDTPLDAQEWEEAVATYVRTAFTPKGGSAPAPVACASTSCWQLPAGSAALLRIKAETTLVFAKDVAGADALARGLLGVG